tara:strand:- start:102 stop:728 length:627 start_codon:yes stop_codon:yes gene_type:complete
VIKNNIYLNFLVFLLGFTCLFAQDSAIDILQKVKDNALEKENVFYKFEVTSEFENNLLPMNGIFYIKDERYLIDTPEVDQIYDGEKFYTIIHENEEIIISSKNNTFFNFSPNYIFNFFLEGFDLERKNINKDSYFITAENNKEKGIIYNILINSKNLSIVKIEMIEKSSGSKINKFLTLSYDYNLNVPMSLFKFDTNDYKDYLIVPEN